MTAAGSTTYDLADTTVTLGISDGPRKGQTVSLRQVTRRVPARGGGIRQIHALTSRTDLAAGEVCWRLTSRWREENYFRYARTHFALDALDSHAATPDDPDRQSPEPGKENRRRPGPPRRDPRRRGPGPPRRQPGGAAQSRARPAGHHHQPDDQRPGRPRRSRLAASWRKRTRPRRPPRPGSALGTLAPDMVRLEAEVKQITHAIRMAAYNTETALARALDGHYARAGDEAYALIREALTVSGDIIPGHGQLLIRLDPLTAPRRTQALAALCDQLTQAQACYPGTDLILRYEVKSRPSPA